MVVIYVHLSYMRRYSAEKMNHFLLHDGEMNSTRFDRIWYKTRKK